MFIDSNPTWDTLLSGMRACFAQRVEGLVTEAMPNAVWHPIVEGGHFINVGEAPAILALALEEVIG